MTFAQHASHTHEELQANVVVVFKFEWTHEASQVTHHNMHIHCQVCGVLVACLEFAYRCVRFRVVI